MSGCNRYTVGVIIGSLYLLGFLLLALFFTWHLIDVNLIQKDHELKRDDHTIGIILDIFVFLILAIFSALLIRGILKRCEYYMVPWIVFYIMGSIITSTIFFFGAPYLASFLSDSGVFILLFTVIGITILQIATLVFMCTLCFSIHKENKRNTTLMGEGHMSACDV
ncbi:uncharacterized protein ACRADG_012139 [Cochliomyia hominivorax]